MSETSHGVATLDRLGARIRAASSVGKNELITILRAGCGAAPLNVREAAHQSALVRGVATKLTKWFTNASQEAPRRPINDAASAFLVTSPALPTTKEWASVRGRHA